jgi:hypothetical protein
MIDERTIAELAKEAIAVQDACNLSGVVHGFSRAITRLRTLLEAQGKGGTDNVNRHPICVLWADKIADLAGREFSPAYSAARDLSATTPVGWE